MEQCQVFLNCCTKVCRRSTVDMRFHDNNEWHFLIHVFIQKKQKNIALVWNYKNSTNSTWCIFSVHREHLLHENVISPFMLCSPVASIYQFTITYFFRYIACQNKSMDFEFLVLFEKCVLSNSSVMICMSRFLLCGTIRRTFSGI